MECKSAVEKPGKKKVLYFEDIYAYKGLYVLDKLFLKILDFRGKMVCF